MIMKHLDEIPGQFWDYELKTYSFSSDKPPKFLRIEACHIIFYADVG